jgi:hypothetical protein
VWISNFYAHLCERANSALPELRGYRVWVHSQKRSDLPALASSNSATLIGGAITVKPDFD